MCVPPCARSVPGGQKRASESLGPELQTKTWVLGIKPRSFVGAASALNHCYLSSQLMIYTLSLHVSESLLASEGNNLVMVVSR